jgi:ATP-binding cassette subfamily F protein 3
MIFLNNISLSFATKRIFAGINWTIGDKSRIGLVGDNGTGKTTLLRAIMGQIDLDEGTIDIAGRKNRTIGYLPQDLVELEPLPLIAYLKVRCGIATLEESISRYEEAIATSADLQPGCELLRNYENTMAEFNAKGGYAFEARAKQVLNGVGFRDDEFQKKCTEFSGGWKMRILLSVILISRPDIMLLDEPTNHLDTESMEWLESYMKDYQGTIVAIAHDRVFLDKIVTQIAELAGCTITIYKGNYSSYLKEKEQRLEALKKETALQRAEIKRTQEFVERFRFKATKARQVQSRLKMLERLETVERHESSRTVSITFPEGPKSGREVVAVHDLSKSYDDRPVIEHIDFRIHRGEKIALVGINGSGKSTLSRLLGQVEEPTAGSVRYGLNVAMSFFSQESAQNLNYEQTVWEDINTVATMSNDQEKRNILGAFLFSGDEIHKPVSVLSGGEKSRLALLKILLTESNFLILDEPTNHLDLRTKDIFQNALLNYRGTLLIVSHDRYFLDHLIHRVIEIRDGRIHDYPGNYSYFIEKRKSLMEEASLMAATPSSGLSPIDASEKRTAGVKTKEEKRREAEDRNRLSRLRRAIEKDLQKVESEISAREARKADIEKMLCQPATLKDGEQIKKLTMELKAVTAALENDYHNWNDLVARFAEIENPA